MHTPAVIAIRSDKLTAVDRMTLIIDKIRANPTCHLEYQVQTWS